jgi:nucleoside-diphosphate-sugar epimerase
MKWAVTGASGYVGGAIARQLEQGGHTVLRLSRRVCSGPWQRFALGDDPSAIDWDGIDGFVHAAYDFSPRTWEEIEACNVLPSQALFSSAREAGVRHLVLISTLSAFDGCRSLYGKAKKAMEKDAQTVGATVIRPGLVWGDAPGGMMGALDGLVSRLPVVPYLCGGGALRQYLVHEQDLAASVVAWATREPEHEPIPVAHPAPVAFRDLLSEIAKRRNLRRLFLPVPWPCAMAALKLAEACGIPLPFRSDSLTGLVHGSRHVAFRHDPTSTLRAFVP